MKNTYSNTITLDLIVAMPISTNRYNAAITITDKFTKLIGMIPGCVDQDGKDQALGALSFWQIANQGIPTVIISDRDPKFIQGLQKALFDLIYTKLFFTTAYYL